MNCNICFENYNDSTVKPFSITPCGHTFCEKCLDNLLANISLPKCPKCKVQIKGKIINCAILDVLDMHLVPDSNVALKRNVGKCLDELQNVEIVFVSAYEQKLKENKDRIRMLKEEINNQTIDLINQIKQNRVSLFKNADYLEAQMNESLIGFLQAEQQIERNVHEFNETLKNMNVFERGELHLYKERLETCKMEFDLNVREMKHFSFKLEFKKFTTHQPNVNFIGDIYYLNPLKLHHDNHSKPSALSTPKLTRKDSYDMVAQPAASNTSIDQAAITPKLTRKYSHDSEPQPAASNTSIDQKVLTPKLTRKYSNDSEPQVNTSNSTIDQAALTSSLLSSKPDRRDNLREKNFSATRSANTSTTKTTPAAAATETASALVTTTSKSEKKPVSLSITLLTTIKSTGKIKALIALPNGCIASGSRDGTVAIWDPKSGLAVHKLEGHTNAVNTLTLIANDYLASGSTDATIKIWSINTGTLIKTLMSHTGFVYSLVILLNGNLASASDDSTIKIWDSVTGSVIKTLRGHTFSVLCLCVLKNGYLASGSADDTIKIWNTDTYQARALKSMHGHNAPVTCLCLVQEFLVSASNDRTIKIWNSHNGDLINTLTGHKDYVITLCHLSSSLVASGGMDNVIKIWDVQSGQLVKSLNEHSDSVTSMCLLTGTEKGRAWIGTSQTCLASGSVDDSIKIWSI